LGSWPPSLWVSQKWNHFWAKEQSWHYQLHPGSSSVFVGAEISRWWKKFRLPIFFQHNLSFPQISFPYYFSFGRYINNKFFLNSLQDLFLFSSSVIINYLIWVLWKENFQM
jgi:hypothetical protein